MTSINSNNKINELEDLENIPFKTMIIVCDNRTKVSSIFIDIIQLLISKDKSILIATQSQELQKELLNTSIKHNKVRVFVHHDGIFLLTEAFMKALKYDIFLLDSPSFDPNLSVTEITGFFDFALNMFSNNQKTYLFFEDYETISKILNNEKLKKAINEYINLKNEIKNIKCFEFLSYTRFLELLQSI